MRWRPALRPRRVLMSAGGEASRAAVERRVFESSVNIDTEHVMAVSGRSSSPVQLPPMAGYLRARAGRGPGGVAPKARRQSLLPYRVTPNKTAMCRQCAWDGISRHGATATGVFPARYTPCIEEGRGSCHKNDCAHTGRGTTVQTFNVPASLGLDGRYPHVSRHSHVI